MNIFIANVSCKVLLGLFLCVTANSAWVTGFVYHKEETRFEDLDCRSFGFSYFSVLEKEPFSIIGGCNIVLYMSCTLFSNLAVLCFVFLFLVHAAVIAINEAIDHRIPADTFTALKNPNAMLVNLEESLASTYQDILYQAKQDKMTNAKNRVKMKYFFFLIKLYSFIICCCYFKNQFTEVLFTYSNVTCFTPPQRAP